MRISVRCVMVSRDHPREYGENNVVRKVLAWGGGSSPRIRGKCGVFDVLDACGGIIPANTGKMICGICASKSLRDHPREYGENVHHYGRDNRRRGSSPRIRGKCQHRTGPTPRGGIIPANTGKILPRTCSFRSLRDHPREYGENRECHHRV